MVEAHDTDSCPPISEITAFHDCIICFVKDRGVKGAETSGKVLKSFRVRREVVSKGSALLAARIRLALNNADDNDDGITFDKVSPDVLEIILRELHEASAPKFDGIELAQVLELAATIQNFGLEGSKFRLWFCDWLRLSQLQLSNKALAKVLLALTWKFDYYGGFQKISRYLVYNSPGHVVPYQPAGFRQFGLHNHMAECLNRARISVKRVLHKQLYSKLQAMFEQGSCSEQAQHAFEYQRHLTQLGCWPIENVLEKSPNSTTQVKTITQLLMHLCQVQSIPKRPEHVCMDCPADWKPIVINAIGTAKNYFDGLCMDCMKSFRLHTLDSSLEFGEE